MTTQDGKTTGYERSQPHQKTRKETTQQLCRKTAPEMLIHRDAEINILDQTPMNCRLPNAPKPPITENSSHGVAETNSWVQTPLHNVILGEKAWHPNFHRLEQFTQS